MSMVLLNKDAIKATYTYTGTDPVLKGYSDKKLSKRDAFAQELFRIWNHATAALSIKTICVNTLEGCDLAFIFSSIVNYSGVPTANPILSDLDDNIMHAMKAYHTITGVKPQIAKCQGDYTTFMAIHHDGEARDHSENIDTARHARNILLREHPGGPVQGFSGDALVAGNNVLDYNGNTMGAIARRYVNLVRLFCFEDSVKVGTQTATYAESVSSVHAEYTSSSTLTSGAPSFFSSQLRQSMLSNSYMPNKNYMEIYTI